jgi:pantoate--beta-alanine ligase
VVCYAQYLNYEERAAAPSLYRALSAAQDQYVSAMGASAAIGASGVVDAEVLIQAANRQLCRQPLFTKVDYISVASRTDFVELRKVGPAGAVISAAVQIGRTRLIDNVLLLTNDSQ